MRPRWAMFLMGAWLFGSVTISVVATQNFRSVDRLLTASGHPVFSRTVEQLGQPQARDLLRYLSSELNRLYFRLWNFAQLVLGFVVLSLIGRDRRARRAQWGVIAMLAVVVVMMFWLTPEITSVGRSLDFVPRDPAPPTLGRFWILHTTYTALEMSKLLFGLVVSVWIARVP